MKTKTKTKSAKVNKAAEVRAYFAANPKAKGNEVVEALGKRGVKVSLPQVYNAKATASPKKKKVRKAMEARASSENGRSVGDKSLHVLEAAFTMLEHMTVDAAKAILDRLSGGKRKAR